MNFYFFRDIKGFFFLDLDQQWMDEFCLDVSRKKFLVVLDRVQGKLDVWKGDVIRNYIE